MNTLFIIILHSTKQSLHEALRMFPDLYWCSPRVCKLFLQTPFVFHAFEQSFCILSDQQQRCFAQVYIAYPSKHANSTATGTTAAMATLAGLHGRHSRFSRS